TAILILGGMVGQYLNVHLNPGLNHGDGAAANSGLGHAAVLYQAAERYARPLPPALITNSITSAQAHHFGAWALSLLACFAYACVFYAVFAWRTATEFRGENLTDTANAVRKAKSAAVRPARSAAPLAAPTASVLLKTNTRNSALTAILGKEILQLRRNTGLIFGLIAPIFFVFLFAGRIASRNDSHWIFPLALVYVLMAIAPLSYNSFGLEGEGAQFYFMAPVRMRDVLLAKNMLGFGIATVDVAVTVVVIAYVAVLPGAPVLIASLLWVVATVLMETLMGNRRSLTAPKKIEVGRVAGKQASQFSTLIAFGILAASSAVAGMLLTLTLYFGHAWLLVPVFAVIAAVAVWLYLQDLERMDAFAGAHRETLIEVLGKKSSS
ncbi:MAG: hypothetical protein ABI142_07845, partial [Bryocella sp.]